MTQEEKTAIHEAGHAVAHTHLGRKVVEVTILETEETFGKCTPEADSEAFVEALVNEELTPELERKIDAEIQTLLAGTIAQEKYTGEWDEVGFQTDMQLAIDLGGALYPIGSEQLDDYFDQVLQVTRDFVDRHWQQILKVKGALIKKKTLTGAEVKVICRSDT